MHRDANENIDIGPEVVDHWPGQSLLTSAGKTPSVLLYNER